MQVHRHMALVTRPNRGRHVALLDGCRTAICSSTIMQAQEGTTVCVQALPAPWWLGRPQLQQLTSDECGQPQGHAPPHTHTQPHKHTCVRMRKCLQHVATPLLTHILCFNTHPTPKLQLQQTKSDCSSPMDITARLSCTYTGDQPLPDWCTSSPSNPVSLGAEGPQMSMSNSPTWSGPTQDDRRT